MAKKKIVPKKKAAARPRVMLDFVATDGRLEVCQAIAATSTLVTVDVSQTPFRTVPRDLPLRKFGDEKVGISDAQMEIFKAHLKELLDSIPSAIDGIANDASQTVASVQQIVALALGA